MPKSNDGKASEELFFLTHYRCRICGSIISFVLQEKLVRENYPEMFDQKAPTWTEHNEVIAAMWLMQKLYGSDFKHTRRHWCTSQRFGLADFIGVERPDEMTEPEPDEPMILVVESKHVPWWRRIQKGRGH